jgi:hypothetical protein
MSNPFALARKYLIEPPSEALAVIERDTILAVKIHSRLLEDEIWLILDRYYVPTDGFGLLLRGRNSVTQRENAGRVERDP